MYPCKVITLLFFKIIGLFFLSFFSSFICAEKSIFFQASEPMASPWFLETGIRYWLGEGKFKFNLYDSHGSTLLSRLTYQNVITQFSEGFWRLNHQSGVFFKGYIGGGTNINGELLDEDFPPALSIYSRTKSQQAYGRLQDLNVDFGYDFYQNHTVKISPFIGYHYWFTHYSALGCQQVANNPDICTSTPFPYTVDVLNDSAAWHALRLGINAVIQLTR